MPIIKSAVKRMKQTIVRRERNVGTKKDIKSAAKAFHAKPSALALSKAHSELDKAVKKGLIKKNTAARRKAALSAAAKKANVKLIGTAKKSITKTSSAKKTIKTAAPVKKTVTKKPATKKQPAKKAA